jgi:hypothetical protein
MITVIMLAAATVGVTHSFLKLVVVEPQSMVTGYIDGEVSSAGDAEFSYIIGDEDEGIQPRYSYFERFALKNTGTVGAHVRAYVTCVWEDSGGVQVALPGELLSVVSFADDDAGWKWIESPEGYWDREKSDAGSDGVSALSAGESAAFGIELRTAELPPQAEGKNVKVKVSVELIGEKVYELLF